ncbi:MAG: SiaC family regulatory phosphoprotein [Erysipelotrichaceae bacterium]
MDYYLEIESTKTSPYVLIDEKNHHMKIKGPAFDDEFLDQHKEIDSTLTPFLESDFDCFTLDLELLTTNVATLIYILLIIQRLEKSIKNKNCKATLNYIVSESNEEVLQCGRDLKSAIKVLDYNLIINKD